jgi:hypothetical protein
MILIGGVFFIQKSREGHFGYDIAISAIPDSRSDASGK